jgi:hypothetical protein
MLCLYANMVSAGEITEDTVNKNTTHRPANGVKPKGTLLLKRNGVMIELGLPDCKWAWQCKCV